MFRLFAVGRGGTCRPKKAPPAGSKGEQFSAYCLKTLGSGDLLGLSNPSFLSETLRFDIS